MSFDTLGLTDPLLRAVKESGYVEPTPIQVKAIPALLAGRDLLAAAQTGTGKTAGFLLPLLQRLAAGPEVRSNHIRALVLVPTRELAMQVAENVTAYGKYLGLKSTVVYGGVKINPQMMRLRGGIDLLVATPGRLLDLFSQNALKFAQVEALVLDEADRMLDLGFIADLRKIMALLPKQRQNALFSATFSDDIRKLSRSLLNKPLQVEVNRRSATAQGVRQTVYEVDKAKKPTLLSHLVRNRGWQQVLVFVRTKNGADRLVKKLLDDGVEAAAIHGGKSQSERSRALVGFRQNRICVLVATDVAARGLDISELPYVVNFDLPKVPEDYVHRIGRTGRAGLQGEAISLVSADEVKLLATIEMLIRKVLDRETETGFVPNHQVPMSRDVKVRAKKPKKPKQKAVDEPGPPVEQTGRHKKPRKGAGPEAGKPKPATGGRGRRRIRDKDEPAQRAATPKSRRAGPGKSGRGKPRK